MSEIAIYVIGPRDGPHKIGVAKDARRRLSELQVANHIRLHLAFSVQVPIADVWAIEGHAHWLLRDRQIGGEWFSVSSDEAVIAVQSGIAAVKTGEQKGSRSVGRKKRWSEDMQARFPEGTFDRIDAVLTDGEERTAFVREAVEREIKRRERKS